MNIAQLRTSRALWRSREIYRYRRWRHYVKTKPVGHDLREKWHDLYVEARAQRKHRDQQLFKLPATNVDQAGIDLIKREEGFRTSPYNDSRGFATVGVGHLIARRPFTAADVRKWTLTDREVDALLAKDLERFEPTVRRAFSGKNALKATHNRFNAGLSLAFNIGAGGFATSTAFKRIHAGDAKGAADAFLMWDHPPELRPRREREKALFLK